MVEQKFTHASGASFNPGYAENPLPIPAKTPIPDFLGIAKSSVQLMDAVNTDAFIQGRIDALAGNIDEDKFFGRSAYLQGAEFVDYSTKLNEAKALILDDINKTVAENGTVEDFKQRFYKRTQGLSETITSFSNRPEARNLMLQHLTALADGSTQQFVAQRLEHRYKLAEAEDFSTASQFLNAVMDGTFTDEMWQSTKTVLDKNALERGGKTQGTGTILSGIVASMMPGLNVNSSDTQIGIKRLHEFFLKKRSDGSISDADYTKIEKAISPVVKQVHSAQAHSMSGRLDRMEATFEANPNAVLSTKDYNQNRDLISLFRSSGVDSTLVESLETKNYKLWLKTNRFQNADFVSMNSTARTVSGVTADEQMKAQVQWASAQANGDPGVFNANLLAIGAQTGNESSVSTALDNLKTNAMVIKDGTTDQVEFVDASAIDALAKGVMNPFVRDIAIKKYGSNFVDFLDTQYVPGMNLAELNKSYAEFNLNTRGSGIKGYANGLPKVTPKELESKLYWSGANVSTNMASYLANRVSLDSTTLAMESARGKLWFSSEEGAFIKQMIGRGHFTEVGSNVLVYSPVALQNVLGGDTASINDTLKYLVDDKISDFDPSGRDYLLTYNPRSEVFELLKDDGDNLVPQGLSFGKAEALSRIQASEQRAENRRQEQNAKVEVETVWSDNPSDAYQKYNKETMTRTTVIGTSAQNSAILGQAMMRGLQSVKSVLPPKYVETIEQGINSLYIQGDPDEGGIKQQMLQSQFEHATGKSMATLVEETFIGDEHKGKIPLPDGSELSPWGSFAEYFDTFNSTNFDPNSWEYHGTMDRSTIERVKRASELAERTGNTIILNDVLEASTGRGLDSWALQYAQNMDTSSVFRDANKNIITGAMGESFGELIPEAQEALLNIGLVPLEATVDALMSAGMTEQEAKAKTLETVDLVKKQWQTPEYLADVQKTLQAKVPFATEEINDAIANLGTYGIVGGDKAIEKLDYYRPSSRKGILVGPYTITADIPNGVLGNAGVDIVKGLYWNEGFIIAPANTRSEKDQKDPTKRQVHVIGLGVSQAHKQFYPAFVASQGDPYAMSVLNNKFINWYFSNMPSKASALGMDWKELTDSPETRPLVTAWCDFQWHGGQYTKVYDTAIDYAKHGDLQSALRLLKDSRPYLESGAERRKALEQGLVVATRL